MGNNATWYQMMGGASPPNIYHLSLPLVLPLALPMSMPLPLPLALPLSMPLALPLPLSRCWVWRLGKHMGNNVP
jgi:hypothetical protein